MVVLPELFLLFLPPFLAWLWVLVLAGGVVVVLPLGAALSVDPVACENESVAPSSRANAMVTSFFIQSPPIGIRFLKSVKILGEFSAIIVQRSAKKESGQLKAAF